MKNRGVRVDAQTYFLPFILGNSREAHRLSVKIFRKYGIISLVCSPERSLLDFFDFTCRFVGILSTESDRLLCEQLIDLSKQNPFTLPILVPVDGRYKKSVCDNAGMLEKTFILSSAEKLFTDSPLATLHV